MRVHTALLLVLLAAPVFAGEAAPPAAQKENIFKRAGKDMKHSAKAGWSEAKKT
jgi:hypothetical protein